jgi:phosphatidate phosphatase LPIN
MLGSLMGSFQDLNLATLSGAIDVIAVRHADGTLVSTPFHVRFGKLQLIRSNEKQVNLTVNDEEVELTMKLGRNGEAYFMLPVGESKEDRVLLSDLTRIDSVFPDNKAEEDEDEGQLLKATDLKKLQGFVDEDEDLIKDLDARGAEEKQTDTQTHAVGGESTKATKVQWEWGGLPTDVRASEGGVLSPTSLKHRSKRGWMRSMLSNLWRGRSTSNAGQPKHNNTNDNNSSSSFPSSSIPSSTASADGADDAAAVTEECTSSQNEARVRSSDLESQVDGVGDEADDEDVDAEESGRVRRSFSIRHGARKHENTSNSDVGLDEKRGDQTIDSAVTHPASVGNVDSHFNTGQKAAVYPSSAVLAPGATEISVCGDLLSLSDAARNAEVFAECRLSYQELCAQPSVLFDPNLVFGVLDKIYDSKVALPLLISKVVYDKPFVLDKEQIAGLESDYSHTQQQAQHQQPQQQPTSSSSSSPAALTSADSSSSSSSVSEQQQQRRGWLTWFRSNRTPQDEKGQQQQQASATAAEGDKSPGTSPSLQPLASVTPTPSTGNVETIDGGNFSTDGEMEEEYRDGEDGRMYKRSLRPSQDMLNSLNLKPGKNEICFTVHSSLQGTQSITGRVFLWTPEQKIVISDVDGTITRSDILGNLLPLVGRDWSHAGVAELFTKIKNNGFEVLYLTARGIGQSNVTKSFISNLRQGKYKLPDGPVILSSLRLAESFKVEVIDRRPHEFKILALRNVRLLFSIFGKDGGLLSQRNPFYAGFGNRLSDVLAYRTCGVPIGKIFLINHHGKIGHINTEYMKTYGEMSTIADKMFPPSDAKSNTGHSYSTSKYWARPMFDIEALEAESELAAHDNDTK